jgi:hypothetical protein
MLFISPTGSGNMEGKMTRIRYRLAAMIVTVALIAACSGGSNAPTGAPPTDSYTITDADIEGHLATIDAVNTRVDALLATNAQPTSEALAAAIASVPGVLATGTASGYKTSAWAELPPGGIRIVVAIGPDPDTPAQVARAEAGIASAPSLDRPRVAAAAAARSYILMSDGDADQTPRIQKILDGKGYTGWSLPATVENLRGIGSPNIFYLDAHGFMLDNCWEDGKLDPYYMISTLTSMPADVSLWPTALRKDFDWRRVGYLLVKTKNGARKFITINVKFAQHYWRFPDDSFFFLEACNGASKSMAEVWQRTLLKDLNLAAYAGWDGEVEMYAGADIAVLFFDRLVGGNSVNPIPNPPQRPFDPLNVLKELTGLGRHFTGGPSDMAILKVVPRSRFVAAPSIATLAPDVRKNQLTIPGQFPKDPGASRRTVKVSGTPVPVVSWTEDVIVTELPPGNGGDVIVTTDEVDGNPVQLTEWRATISFDSTLDTVPPAPLISARKANLMFTIRFRADVHDYRPAAGDPPIRQVLVPFEIEEGSSLAGNWAVTINLPPAGMETVPMAGSTSQLGRLDYSDSWGWFETTTWPLTGFLDGLGWIDVSNRKLYLGILGLLNDPSIPDITGNILEPMVVHPYLLLDDTDIISNTCNVYHMQTNGMVYFVFDLQESFTVAAGSCKVYRSGYVSNNTPPYTYYNTDLYSWQFVTAAPPDLQAPR